MNKTVRHRGELAPLLDGFVSDENAAPLRIYITSHSNLPGPRANLELAQAFSQLVEMQARQHPRVMWDLCQEFTLVTPAVAPVNDPREFLPFCGAIGLGAMGAVSPDHFPQVLAVLKALADDSRWRVREAVCFGLQRLLAVQQRDTLDALIGWVTDGTWLEIRAAGVAVAEPVLLQDVDFARQALELQERALQYFLTGQTNRSDSFLLLRKAMGFALSVVVAAVPKEGFYLLRRLAAHDNPDVDWILKENLKKKRLTGNFPAEISELVTVLTRK